MYAMSRFRSFALLLRSGCVKLDLFDQSKYLNDKYVFNTNLYVNKPYSSETPSAIPKSVSVQECVSHVAKRFEANGISESHQSAALIVAQTMGVKTLNQLKTREKRQLLADNQISDISIMMQKRLTNMPIQYVLEEWDFRDLTLKMEPPVFIPRPETEELVGFILSQKEFSDVNSSFNFVEIGTGSGAISISLLKERFNSKACAFEQEKPAFNLTKSNAEIHQVIDRMTLFNTPLTSERIERCANEIDILFGKVDFVVSNPPYIPKRDMENLQTEVKDFEDHNALCGGLDGLDVIRNIIELSSIVLKKDGALWLEVDSTHPPLLRSLSGSLKLEEVYNDFMGIPRFGLFKK